MPYLGNPLTYGQFDDVQGRMTPRRDGGMPGGGWLFRQPKGVEKDIELVGPLESPSPFLPGLDLANLNVNRSPLVTFSDPEPRSDAIVEAMRQRGIASGLAREERMAREQNRLAMQQNAFAAGENQLMAYMESGLAPPAELVEQQRGLRRQMLGQGDSAGNTPNAPRFEFTEEPIVPGGTSNRARVALEKDAASQRVSQLAKIVETDRNARDAFVPSDVPTRAPATVKQTVDKIYREFAGLKDKDGKPSKQAQSAFAKELHRLMGQDPELNNYMREQLARIYSGAAPRSQGAGDLWQAIQDNVGR